MAKHLDMSEHQAARTLVKSAPELWEACSEEASLARHLKQFGEIRITRLEPETAVAWEGDRTSGTVRLEPSGWGTRVTLTASALDVVADEPLPEAQPDRALAPELGVEPDPEVEPEVEVAQPVVFEQPAPDPVAAQPRRPGFWQRLFGRRRAGAQPPPVAAEPVAAPEPVAVAEPVAAAEPAGVLEPVAVVEPVAEVEIVVDGEPPETLDPVAALAAALDSLGRAHHRPFSRG